MTKQNHYWQQQQRFSKTQSSPKQSQSGHEPHESHEPHEFLLRLDFGDGVITFWAVFPLQRGEVH